MEKTLLKKLTKALSKVSGNTITMYDDEHKRDEYYCDICKEYVPEDEYNDSKRCCYSCGWKIEKGDD